MEKITREFILNFLNENDFELKSSHARLCLPIINRLYKKMLIGVRFSSIKVVDGIIIDGHHRYIAAQLAAFPLESVPSLKSSGIIITSWKSIEYAKEDWDTPAKIIMLNENDARYNGLSVGKMIDAIK